MMARPTEVAIVAFGLEHCKRGVEAHARMLFEKLKLEPGISVSLIKGSGKRRKDEVVLSVPKRHTWLNRFLGKLRGYNIYWEQVFFMIRLFFYLVQNARELDYIYTQEYVHMVGLGRLKKVFGWSYDLVYCEGFVSKSETRLKHADILQEVNKTNFDYICPKAESVGKPCHLIPHFFDPIWEDSRQDAPILNEIQYFKGDKRMLLYVGPTELEEKNFERIEEAVQNLGDGWCLLVCGDMDPERLERMNKETGCMTKSVYVAHDIMQRIYPMADLFVLPSVDEAFGIATIEAMGHGIPVLLHHSAHSLWLCNDTEQCTDMTRPEAIERFIQKIEDLDSFKLHKGTANQAYFLETFTWEKLREKYLSLFDSKIRP